MQHDLTSAELDELRELIAKNGLNGAARVIGIDRSVISSLVMGRARPGSVALFRLRRANSAPANTPMVAQK